MDGKHSHNRQLTTTSLITSSKGHGGAGYTITRRFAAMVVLRRLDLVQRKSVPPYSIAVKLTCRWALQPTFHMLLKDLEVPLWGLD
jgi:hypothetical protein